MQENCICPVPMSHMEELCEPCQREYIHVLETEAREERERELSELQTQIEASAERVHQMLAYLKRELARTGGKTCCNAR